MVLLNELSIADRVKVIRFDPKEWDRDHKLKGRVGTVSGFYRNLVSINIRGQRYLLDPADLKK